MLLIYYNVYSISRIKKHTTFKGTPNFAHEKAHDLSTSDAITKAYKVIPVNISIQY